MWHSWWCLLFVQIPPKTPLISLSLLSSLLSQCPLAQGCASGVYEWVCVYVSQNLRSHVGPQGHRRGCHPQGPQRRGAGSAGVRAAGDGPGGTRRGGSAWFVSACRAVGFGPVSQRPWRSDQTHQTDLQAFISFLQCTHQVSVAQFMHSAPHTTLHSWGTFNAGRKKIRDDFHFQSNLVVHWIN